MLTLMTSSRKSNDVITTVKGRWKTKVLMEVVREWAKFMGKWPGQRDGGAGTFFAPRIGGAESFFAPGSGGGKTFFGLLKWGGREFFYQVRMGGQILFCFGRVGQAKTFFLIFLFNFQKMESFRKSEKYIQPDFYFQFPDFSLVDFFDQPIRLL